ncbi:MAG: molecular chaperone HtpG [Gammaproteobacteria bacterium]|nr:molecular chaperone HtpG [Gammaproteobacteria bacterium]MDH5800043.1 molecular chaperone HtpG [Gammaproteobacteria bacterium]
MAETEQESQKETLGFQTEVKHLLKLMIHSLYSNKEIFLRELISNASDAADKLRFEALTDSAMYEDDPELKIHVSYDKDAHTVTVSDNGVGMTRQEVMDHIGTIAKSGTKQFFESLTGDQAKDAHLIGQFGVGFYSAFIVAEKVTLSTRKAGMEAAHGVRWESAGEGDYTIETVERAQRGTEVVLHLRKDEEEFLSGFRLRNIINKYSDHITLPIRMLKESYGEEEGKEQTQEYETVNQASALWTRSKSDITDEEYDEFYKHVAHDFEAPLAHSHNRVEGTNEYISLLYIPSRAPFDLWDRQSRHGVKLYVKRVFIMDDAEQLMPTYLRFVRGIIDSSDLPLNVSREILQQNKTIDTIRAGSIKKILGTLEEMAKKDAEKYSKFWQEFGKVLKEGPGEDFANKERIAGLFRFSTTHTDSEDQTVSLDDYIGRMQEGQDSIYYITADAFAAAKNSPHLEIFRKKGIEVILFYERVDEWLVSSLMEYKGKKLLSVTKGELDLGELDDEAEKEEQKKAGEELKGVLEQIKTTLGDKVKDVRLTHRLTSSPACLVNDEHDMNANLERILKQAGQNVPSSRPIFELNPDHPLVAKLKAETDDERFNDLTLVLFDQALLSEGGQLDDPASFVKRFNELLLAMSK